MANLISSKQIAGVVTASVIAGDFEVSGSSHITGSFNVTGSINASSTITANNFVGSGTTLTGVELAGRGIFSGSEQLPSGIISGSEQLPAGLISGSSQLTTEFDARYGNELGDGLISGSVLRPGGDGVISGSSQIEFGNINNLPAGIVSGSIQILGSSDVVSGSSQITFSSISSIPTGIVSGSSQINYDDIGGIPAFIGGTNVTVTSGSGGITINSTGGGGEGGSTDISHLNQYTASTNARLNVLETDTGSQDSRLDNLEEATGSYLTQSPAGTISGSAQITSLGFISASGENASLNAFTSSATAQLTNLETFTGSVLISSSAQITAFGFVSESGDSTPAGTISGSKQITDLGFISSSDSTTSLNTYTASNDINITNIHSTTSSLEQRVGQIESNTGSYDDQTVITSLNTFTASNANTSLNAATSSYISNSATSSMTVNSASIAEYTSEWKLTAEGSNHYVFQGPGFTGSASDPNIYLVRGQKYKFTNNMGAHPFRIQTTPNGASGTEYNNGVTNNNVSNGTLIFDVPMEAPDVLYYQCTSHGNMGGAIFISHVSGSSGGSTDITSLNSYTASNTINITNIHSTTASLAQRVGSIESVSGSYLTSLDSGIVSGAGQIGALGYISASQVSSSIGFDGNRTVSNTDLPSGVYNNNFGTSGSIQNFLESVFFPNTAPTINSVSFSIDEFEDINSIVGTISATDAEGQTMTFATQSGYSADKFTINSSTGVITARARTTSSINTDTSVFAGGAHPFLMKATDTFGGSTNKTIHIRVTPNTAPKFREGSASGTIITSVTASFNENSANDALVKRVYFTDDESDSITLTSTSIDNNHFDIHKYSNYFDIRQNTASLDYEVQSLYTFAVTASDEHFLSASQGTVGQTILPISVSVTDNVHPTINNQTLSSISENSSNGAAVATISATDNEGDTITFSDFTLYKLELDDVNVSSASYGGTSQSDPTNDAFQCSGTGAVTRKNGVYINSDLINEYQYTVRIRDSYNTASNEAIITIPISDDTPPTVSDNWSTPYVIESAVSGASVYVNSNGRSGTIAAFSANQSVTWTLNSGSGVFDINSSTGRLSIKTNLSGSTTSSGALLSGSSIATNTFGTTTETPFTASVAANQAPSISFTDQSAKFETDLALSGVTMVSMSVSDDESDTPFSASLSGSDLELVYSNANSSSIGLHLTENATARQYFYSVTITDQFGKSQTYSDRSFTISESPDYGKVYVYRSDYGSDSGLSSNYSAVMGISTTNGATPPEVTAFTANDTSPMRLISSSLGDASLS